MSYYFNKILKTDFDEIVSAVTSSFAASGFGVVTEMGKFPVYLYA
jgi:uncharacterized protein (DUF302 family)